MNKKNGFTLLEAIVATSMVIIGIIGILIFSQEANLIIYDARDRLTAAYLAKEGTEIVRNIKDKNWLRGESWNDELSEGNWEADHSTDILTAYSGAFLRVHPITRIFSYDNVTGDEVTIFKRKITITDLTADSIKVEIAVEWKNYTFLLEENLYNWR